MIYPFSCLSQTMTPAERRSKLFALDLRLDFHPESFSLMTEAREPLLLFTVFVRGTVFLESAPFQCSIAIDSLAHTTLLFDSTLFLSNFLQLLKYEGLLDGKRVGLFVTTGTDISTSARSDRVGGSAVFTSFTLNLHILFFRVDFVCCFWLFFYCRTGCSSKLLFQICAKKDTTNRP